MHFAQLIEQVRDAQTVSIPAVWGQGRTVFGGLSVAMVYEAMRLKIADARPIRSLAVTFVGPLMVDEPVRFEVQVLREGKSVSQVLGKAIQNGAVQVLVQGSFGHSRESLVSVKALPTPDFAPWQQCPNPVFKPESMPAFVQYLAVRWAQGQPPASNSRERFIGGWVQLRDAPLQTLDVTHILALVDAWPPATLSHLPERKPSSSLTWTIEFVQPLAQLTTDDWCAYQAEIEHAVDGYGHIAARLWAPDGSLIALSRQTVTLFG